MPVEPVEPVANVPREIVPREFDPPQGAIDTAITAMGDWTPGSIGSRGTGSSLARAATRRMLPLPERE